MTAVKYDLIKIVIFVSIDTHRYARKKQNLATRMPFCEAVRMEDVFNEMATREEVMDVGMD